MPYFGNVSAMHCRSLLDTLLAVYRKDTVVSNRTKNLALECVLLMWFRREGKMAGSMLMGILSAKKVIDTYNGSGLQPLLKRRTILAASSQEHEILLHPGLEAPRRGRGGNRRAASPALYDGIKLIYGVANKPHHQTSVRPHRRQLRQSGLAHASS